jgi:hypothetical protein
MEEGYYDKRNDVKEGSMDSHSRGNKRQPKGFPVQGEVPEKKLQHILHAKPSLKKRKARAVTPPFQAPRSYLIVRAYREFEGSDFTEELIMQRDYIID